MPEKWLKIWDHVIIKISVCVQFNLNVIIHINFFLKTLLCMSCYAFCGASRYRAETLKGDRFESILSRSPHQRSNVIQRSIYLRNAVWLSHLVGRTPDQSLMHCWGQKVT